MILIQTSCKLHQLLHLCEVDTHLKHRHFHIDIHLDTSVCHRAYFFEPALGRACMVGGDSFMCEAEGAREARFLPTLENY